VPVCSADIHAVFIALAYAIYSNSANSPARWLSGKSAGYDARCYVQLLLAQKFIFFLISYMLVFIVMCDLFSWTFILIITCTSLC